MARVAVASMWLTAICLLLHLASTNNTDMIDDTEDQNDANFDVDAATTTSAPFHSIPVDAATTTSAPFHSIPVDANETTTETFECYVPVPHDSSKTLQLTTSKEGDEDVFQAQVYFKIPTHKKSWDLAFQYHGLPDDVLVAGIRIQHEPDGAAGDVLILHCARDSEDNCTQPITLRNSNTRGTEISIKLQIGTSWVEVNLTIPGNDTKDVNLHHNCTTPWSLDPHLNLSTKCLSDDPCGLLRSSCTERECYVPVPHDSSKTLQLTTSKEGDEDVFQAQVYFKIPTHKKSWDLAFQYHGLPDDVLVAEIRIQHEPDGAAGDVLILHCARDSEDNCTQPITLRNSNTRGTEISIKLQIGTSWVGVNLTIPGNDTKDVNLHHNCTTPWSLDPHLNLSTKCLSDDPCGLLRSSCTERECRLGGRVPRHSHPVSLMLSYTTTTPAQDAALHTHINLYPPHLYPTIFGYRLDIDDSWIVTLNLTSLSKEMATLEFHYGPNKTDVVKMKCGEDSEVTITKHPWNTPTSLLTSYRILQLQVGVGLVWVTETVEGGEERDVGKYNCTNTSPLPHPIKLTMACGYKVGNCGSFNSSCTRDCRQEVTLPNYSLHPLVMRHLEEEGKVVVVEAQVTLHLPPHSGEWLLWLWFLPPPRHQGEREPGVYIHHYQNDTFYQDILNLYCDGVSFNDYKSYTNPWQVNHSVLATPHFLSLQMWRRGLRLVENTGGLERTVAEYYCTLSPFPHFPYTQLVVWCGYGTCPNITQSCTSGVTTMDEVVPKPEQVRQVWQVRLFKTVVKMVTLKVVSAVFLAGGLTLLWIRYFDINLYLILLAFPCYKPPKPCKPLKRRRKPGQPRSHTPNTDDGYEADVEDNSE